MAEIRFVVPVDFDQPPRMVWNELIDWKGHQDWVPMTRVEIHSADPTAVGSTFTAWTGPRPFALEDRMRVVSCAWDVARGSGSCTVEKLGPTLDGEARFTVEPRGSGSRVEWTEDVAIAWLPGFLAPVVARIGALGFKLGMRRLRRSLAS